MIFITQSERLIKKKKIIISVLIFLECIDEENIARYL